MGEGRGDDSGAIRGPVDAFAVPRFAGISTFARPTYVSIDIDVLDPAFAPGTGTSEPGGLQSREVLAILRALDGPNLIGADVVEVSPPFDHAEITSLAAANLAYELIGRLGGGRREPAYEH